MALPVNIEKLIHGKTVEWERLELKKSWNPAAVLHTLCAFANDINDWDGGYIIIGVEESNGQPVLPPNGLEPDQLDAVQKKLIELCNKHIQPNYRPIVEPEVYQDKHILILWCPAGDMRPYKVPKNLGKEINNKLPYIRSGTNSIEAKGENLRQLQELTARTPFDDRINQEATLDDLDLGLIREYLQEIKSRLFDESHKMPFNELCRQMYIVKGGSESLRPVNVGLMFFNRNPDRFFPYAWIEMVIHKDDSGRNFIEKVFKGPLNRQLTDALEYIRNNVIVEEVKKSMQKAEADRFYNYPYEAVEEVLSNAVYHKGYDQANPIEVQVYPREAIEVLSYPGPVPPINNRMLQQRRVTARHYRNRRIGEFLKELDLTEGKATGFPVIRNAMQNNGSPEPEFFTDEERTIFQATLKIHPWFTGQQPEGREYGKIHISSKDWNMQSLEDVDALLNYLLKRIYDHVSNQVTDQAGSQAGNQVQNPEKESDISKSGQLGYREGNYVEDIVRDIIGDVISDIVARSYIAENKSNVDGEKIQETQSNIVNDHDAYAPDDFFEDDLAKRTIEKTIDKGLNISLQEYFNVTKVIKRTIERTIDEFKSELEDTVSNKNVDLLEYCLTPRTRREILKDHLKIYINNANFKRNIQPFIHLSWIYLTIPDKPTSKNQAYYTTTKGKILLLLMNKDYINNH